MPDVQGAEQAAQSRPKVQAPPGQDLQIKPPEKGTPSRQIDKRLAPMPDAAARPVITTQQRPGDEPATIEAPTAPGKAGSMEVVVAAEVLRRVARTRQAVSLVSQVIIRAYEEEALHAEVCRQLVTFGGYLMAWIGLAEEEEEEEGKPKRTVRPIAHAGLEPNFLSALKITWSNDLANRSPTSRAIQEQRPHVARNILKEPRFAVLRKDAQLYGYTATCALPLQFAQYGMGVLTIHAMEPDAFNAEEVALLRELAGDLAAGVISLRERGERQLLEERLAAVIDAADDAIIGADLHGRISDWNAGATRLFGYERDEALGKTVSALLVPPEMRAEEAQARKTIGDGERVPRFETVRVCKEGQRIHTSATMSPIFGDDGIVTGATTIEHDITAARAAEAGRRAAQLEESEVSRLKGLEGVRRTFISEASHELNTPLTPLRIHVEALAERPDITPPQRDHLLVIQRNVTRLSHLVRDMLEASRLETGRFKLELTDFPLAVLIEDTMQSVAESATKVGVALEHGPLARFVALADRDRTSQVLHNLLTNAIAFTPKGGRVTVSVQLDKGAKAAIVRVTDTGLGLSEEQIEQLFQAFSRPHERSGASPKGTGLGLFISKGIIEQHGGRIWAESAGPGMGSSFCFTLPLAVMAPPHAADATKPAVAPDGPGLGDGRKPPVKIKGRT